MTVLTILKRIYLKKNFSEMLIAMDTFIMVKRNNNLYLCTTYHFQSSFTKLSRMIPAHSCIDSATIYSGCNMPALKNVKLAGKTERLKGN